jgi:hypothetical protein
VVISEMPEAEIGAALDRFTEETGIAIDARYADPAPQSGAAATAQPSGATTASPTTTPTGLLSPDVDVFIAASQGSLAAADRDGLLSPLPAKVLERLEPDYRGENGMWAGLGGSLRTLAYNSELVGAPPKDLESVLSAQFAKKVGIAPAEPGFVDFVSALIAEEGTDGAREWLRQLAASSPMLLASDDQVVDELRAGRISVGLTDTAAVFRAQEQAPAPDNLRSASAPPGDPADLFTYWGAAVAKGSPEPDASTRLVASLVDLAVEPAANLGEGAGAGSGASGATAVSGGSRASGVSGGSGVPGGSGESGAVDPQGAMGPFDAYYPPGPGRATNPGLPDLDDTKPLRIEPSKLAEPEEARALISEFGLG